MGIRSTVGSVLESAIGRERTNTMRSVERRARNALWPSTVQSWPTTWCPGSLILEVRRMVPQ